MKETMVKVWKHKGYNIKSCVKPNPMHEGVFIVSNTVVPLSINEIKEDVIETAVEYVVCQQWSEIVKRIDIEARYGLKTRLEQRGFNEDKND